MGTNKTPKSKTRLYKIYSGMKQRCYNKNNPAYEFYGEKGICICDEWLNDFDAFKTWAEKHGYKEDQPEVNGDKQTIDRIDPSKDYCPENCRWISARENSARAVFARDVKRWAESKRVGEKQWYEKRTIYRRVAQIDRAIELLPQLSDVELDWLIMTIENLIECKDMGFDSTMYFKHGFKPYK